MILKKRFFMLFGLLLPKVSLRTLTHKSIAITLLVAGIGLPAEAAALVSPAWADDAANPAAVQGSEQWMVATYQEGKRLFDIGDYAAAQKEWDKLSGSYDKNPSLKVIVDFMRKRIKEDPAIIQKGKKFQEQQIQNFKKQEETNAKNQKKLLEKNDRENKKQIERAGRAKPKEAQETDDDVAFFLSLAREDVTRQVRSKDKKNMSLDTQRAQRHMLALFAKGKQAYIEGDLQTAIQSWDEAVTYLPPGSQAKAQLEQLKINSRKLAAKRNLPVEAEEPAEEPAEESKPAAAPADMKDFLELVNARFRSEAQEGRARASQKSASSNDRQESLDRSFRKTKLLYFQGEYEQAIDELNALSKYFSPDSEETRLISGLRKNYLEALKAQSEAKDIEPASPAKLQSPKELKIFVEQANRKFDALLQDAKAHRSVGERTSAEREAFVHSAFERAQSFFDKGRIEEALSELERIAPYVENETEILSMVDEVRAQQAETLRAKEALEKNGSGQTRINQAATKGISDFLKDAKKRLEDQSKKINSSKKESENTKRDRARRLVDLYQNARARYDAGDIEGALDLLSKMLPDVEGSEDLAETIESLRADLAESRQAAEELKSMEGGPKGRLPVPANLSSLLSETQSNIRSHAEQMRRKRDEAQRAAEEKKRDFDGPYNAGRAAYNSGDLETALREWDKLVPLVENGQEFERYLSDVRKDYQAAMEAEKASQVIEKEEAIRLPDDFYELLNQTAAQARERAQKASAERTSVESGAAKRQEAVARAYEAGRTAYNAGNLEKAVAEWQALVPLVEGGSALGATLDTLKRDYRTALQAIEAVEAAAKVPTANLKASTELEQLLAEARKQIDTRSRDALAKKQLLEKNASERRAPYDRAVSEGMAAYNSGDLEKAIQSWKKLVPLVEDGAALDKQLSLLGERFRETQILISDTEKVQKALGFHTPADIQKLLNEAQSQIETRGREAKAQKESLEKSAVEKRMVFEKAVSDGHAAYRAGDIEKAVQAWQALVPIVEGGQALEKQLQAIREQDKAMREARSAADAILAQRTSYKLPSEFNSTLSELSKRLASDLAQSNELAAAAQAKVAERRVRVEKAVADGLSLYKNGLSSEALKRWESILPDLVDSDRLQKTLMDLQRAEQDLAVVQKTALQAEVDSKKQLPVPSDLTQALDGGFVAAKSKIEESKNRQTIANTESVRRQTLVTESIQNGKLALARGEVDAAIAEWTKAAPYLQDGQNLIPKLQELKVAHLQLIESQKAAALAEERNVTKIQSLPEIEGFVAEASLKYKNDSDAAKLRQGQAEAAYAEKKAFVEYTLNKAREIFARGDIPGATQEAMKLQPLIEDPIGLQSELGKIQIAYDQSLKAQVEAADSVKRTTSTLFKAPPELDLLIKDADQKVKELSQLALNQKIEAQQALKEKEAFVQQTFERGKKLYWEGKIDEALAQWDSMAPLLENGSKIKEVTGRYEETLHLQRQAREMNFRKEEKFQTPEELQRLLNDAEKILSSQSTFATAQQRAAQDQLSERQEFINRTFQKGKALYEQGMISEAIEEWEELAPLLENGSKVKEFIDSVKANTKGVAEAKKGAEEAQARSILQPQAPADLTRLLAEANQGLQAETQKARTERQQAEAALQEKQKMIDGIFQKGKTLYQSGRLEEAVDVWKTLLPFVDDNTSIRQLIQQAEDSRRTLMAERYESQNNVRSASTPGAMQFALEETNATLKDQIAQQHSARIESDLRALVGAAPGKGAKNALSLDSKSAVLQSGTENGQVPFKLDEIEQMMLEYKVVSPEDLKKRRETLKTAAAPAETP